MASAIFSGSGDSIHRLGPLRVARRSVRLKECRTLGLATREYLEICRALSGWKEDGNPTRGATCNMEDCFESADPDGRNAQ